MTRVLGRGSALGIGQETTVGTAVAPTRWLDVTEESVESVPTIHESTTLRAGAFYARSTAPVLIGKNVQGGFGLDAATRGMGLLYKHMFGAGASAVLTGSAYRQIFTPASLLGLALTLQKQIGSTSYTYNGCKIKSWSLACDTSDNVKLSVDIDAWNEVTSFAAGTPTYGTTELFNFSQGSIVIGGTASTTTGLTTLSGGTTVGIIESITVNGTRPILEGDATRRISAAGKTEQADNGDLTIGGSIKADLDSAFDIYALYAAQTPVAIKLAFTTTATPISGSTYPSLEILIPDVRFRGETPKVGSPEALSLDAAFEGYQDVVAGNPAVQLVSVTADSTIS